MKLDQRTALGTLEEFHHHTLIRLLLMLKPGAEEDEHRLALVLNLTGPESPRDKCLVHLMENYLDWLSFWSCL